MKIRKAVLADFNVVRSIVNITINNIYPRYYPDDVVAFFRDHHCDDRIRADLNDGCVYLAFEDEQAVGTGTVREDEICRMFVLPQMQGKGYGSALLRTLEARVAETHNSARLDSSLPAYSMYIKNGYIPVAWRKVETEEGRVLCYNAMEKILGGFNYNSRVFRAVTDDPNGDVSRETVFHYHEEGRVVWAEYEGGAILKGFLIGIIADDDSMDISWQQVNRKLACRSGRCHAVPEKIKERPGKIRLRESWEWSGEENVPGRSGEFIVEETD